MLDVVGGSTELGAGSVWVVGIEEQSAVLDVVGAGFIKSINTDDCSTGLHICR